MRTVMCIINGQLRPVVVRDRNIADIVPTAEKADRTNPATSPPVRRCRDHRCRRRRRGAAGQTIATIEAMKMEAAITAHKAGVINRVAIVAPRRRSRVVTCWR
jgi:pyruvate carboxylase